MSSSKDQICCCRSEADVSQVCRRATQPAQSKQTARARYMWGLRGSSLRASARSPNACMCGCLEMQCYNHPSVYPPTFSSHSFRQSTFAPNLAHIKKAPLSFLFNEYVSGGGGVNRCFSIIGIRALTESVMVCCAKAYLPGCENGEAINAIESRWALSISYHESGMEG